jgi:hypothetical protein
MKTITTQTLHNVLEDLIKKVTSDSSIANALADRLLSPGTSDMANLAGISSSTPAFLMEKVNEISNYLFRLQDFIQNGIGGIVVQGLAVISTNPISDKIRIQKGFGYISGKKIELATDTVLDVDLNISTSMYVYITTIGLLEISLTPPQNALVLARIDKQSPYSNKIQNHADLDGNGINAYIVQSSDPLFDNNHQFDDDTIISLKNTMQELFAENIFGVIKLHENLTIENIQGSLAMDSREVKIKDPSQNVLAKFNANGVFFYSSLGEEFSHFGRNDARVGKIRVTPSTLESVGYQSGSSGFQIKADGNAEFNNVTVRGTIYSQVGEIGGWTIGATELSGGDASLKSTGRLELGTSNNIATLDAGHATHRLWIGHENPLLAPFNVERDGKLNSVSGLIGGWSIGATELSSGSVSLSSAAGGVITAGGVTITGSNSTIDVGTGIDLLGAGTGSILVGTDINISGAGGGTITVGAGVTLNGSAGSIQATIGQIAGWSLSASKIFSTNIDIDSSSGGTIKAGDILITGSASRIDVGTAIDIIGTGSGSITVGTGITIDGSLQKITLADTGSFVAGDATLTSNGLTINGTYSRISLGTSNNVIKINNSDGIYLGNAVKASAPFSVTMQGELKSTYGEIAGWVISSYALISPGSNLIFDSANKRINVGGTVLIDGANERIESTNYASGVSGWRIDGNGDSEFRNCVVRGRLHTSIFVKDQIHATNGQLLITDAASLLDDIDNTQTKLYVTESVFFIGDRLRMKDGATRDEMLKVTGTGSDGIGDFINVTRNFDSGGAFSWNKGTAVVSIESRVSLVASGYANLPYIDIIERTGDFTESVRARIGNINGISGATGFGLWSENVFLTGKITATSGAVANWEISGNQIKSSNDKIILDSSTEKITVDTIIIDGANNKIDVGSFIDIDGNAGGKIIVGSINDVYLDGATGKIIAKKGEVGGWIINSSGIVSDSGGTPIISILSGAAGTITITNGSSSQIILGKYDGSNYGLKAGDAVLNSSGLTISGTTSSVSLGTGNSIIKINNTDGLFLGNSLQALAPFSVTMAGVIKATSGTIGGWTLGATTLTGGNTELSSTGVVTVGVSNDVAKMSSVDGTYRLWVGHATSGSAPFRVNKNGNLIAENADITGQVKATSGYIGSVANGWSITSSALTNVGNGVIQTDGAANAGIKLDGSSFRGYDASSNERFKLGTDGAGFLGSSSTFSWSASGTVTLGGFTVNNSSLTAGSGATSVGVSASGTYAFYTGNATPSSAPFRVNFNGQLYASNAVITGDISCNTLTATASGNIAGWTITSSALTAGSGAKIRTSSSATVNGLVLDNTGLKGYGDSTQKFSLTAADGRVFAREADIGQRIVKVDASSSSGTAINNAISYLGSAGGIVYLTSGIHYINTTVSVGYNNITIKGAGPYQTELRASTTLSSVINVATYRDNVKIQDLAVDIYDSSYDASYCVYVGSNAKHIEIKNCVFKDATSVNVRCYNYDILKVIDCSFTVKSGSVGLQGDGGFIQDNGIVRDCVFFARTGGAGTGVYQFSSIKDCRFENLDVGVQTEGYDVHAVIDGNNFENCDYGVYCNTSSYRTTIVNNKLRSSNSSAIHLKNAQGNYVISNNHIWDGSGDYGIYIEDSRGGSITGNIIKGCSLSIGIYIDGGGDSYTNSVIISSNVITDCTVGTGIHCNMVTNSYDYYEEGAVISNNNIHNNTGGVGISILDDGAVVQGNLITDLARSGSVIGIDARTDEATITGNVIRELRGSTSNWGIDNYGNNAIVGNTIQINVSSSSNSYGIYNENWVTSSKGLCVNSNRIKVTNPGSGTGYAIGVNVTNGTVLCNSCYGSDSLGTISAGTTGLNDI